MFPFSNIMETFVPSYSPLPYTVVLCVVTASFSYETYYNHIRFVFGVQMNVDHAVLKAIS